MYIADCSSEFVFTASRSSGAGGQNVNKVNSKVELRFHIDSSSCLTEEQKALLQAKLRSHITDDGYLCIRSQVSRSQLQNKEICVQKFYEYIAGALQVSKPRKATKPTQASQIERLHKKKLNSEIKKMRKSPDI
ncbi:MAG TPA: alternative ribosome rescue aminoacyl-tRNA hydrolase ArfB, partial [Bacteroidales bacterium]|jgi:ribosome-associated protein|nr:alternative ribosome rescue aminoacyl-tRNA hydrolase ArfB [Bacteroidales bacterium]HRS19651.1 alternative ribosome rescue aminoacyl-tRNA hydrolase ArfB [Bacteroidales bacterium]